jgi:hypothetical protein
MRRKSAILRQFRRELDDPPSAIMEEVNAVDAALSRAEVMVKAEQVQTAEDMFHENDHKNRLHRTLRRSELDRADISNFPKRQHIEVSTDSEDSGSE